MTDGGSGGDAWLGLALTHVVAGARLLRSWPLSGGVSAHMTAVEAAWPDGSTRRLVFRVPISDDYRAITVAEECRILDRLGALDLPVPKVVHLDVSRALVDQEWAVLAYVEGKPDVSPADPVASAETLAELLVRIHDVEPQVVGLSPSHRRRDDVTRFLRHDRGWIDASTREGEVRDALARVWPPETKEDDRLLHGDFWPGNVLWHDGSVAAVIDWEETTRGDRMSDVGISRLDLLWVYGPDAMRAFTERYVAASGASPDDLPVWDLVAALRPAGCMSLWAAGWPALGRPDITATTMRETHGCFVSDTLAAIGAG